MRHHQTSVQVVPGAVLAPLYLLTLMSLINSISTKSEGGWVGFSDCVFDALLWRTRGF